MVKLHKNTKHGIFLLVLRCPSGLPLDRMQQNLYKVSMYVSVHWHWMELVNHDNLQVATAMKWCTVGIEELNDVYWQFWHFICLQKSRHQFRNLILDDTIR